MTEKIPLWEKANLTIEEAAEFSNIGQNKIAELLKMPRCPFVHTHLWDPAISPQYMADYFQKKKEAGKEKTIRTIYRK